LRGNEKLYDKMNKTENVVRELRHRVSENVPP